VLKVLYGEMSTVILEGQNVNAKRLQELGFEFLYPKIDAALRDLL
jgi:NAD dependent epimerase/dehydratase family enzyme